jgi:hypothetical protein
MCGAEKRPRPTRNRFSDQALAEGQTQRRRQTVLARSALLPAVRDGKGRKTAAMQSPLAGKLFDANGEPQYVQGAVNGQRGFAITFLSGC